MDTAFNKEAAERYDETFTNSGIGKKQRKRVHNYLNKFLSGRAELKILELNCGTGADALYFAKRGHIITATDFSQSMLNIADNKLLKQTYRGQYKSCLLDLKNPAIPENNFDLVFSNFGGLNCLNREELTVLCKFVSEKLIPGGSFIGVVMPPHTFIDKYYRIYKGEKEKHYNRSADKALEVEVNGKNISTFYFQEEELKNIFSKFTTVNILPVGFIPSYLEKSRLKNFLLLMSDFLCTLRFNPNKSDHFLIHFKKQA